MYTTPAKAFEKLDTKAGGEFMDSIIHRAERPLEFDVLREEINERLQLSFSRYFYGAFAKTHAHEFDWHVRKTLCSARRVPWNGLKNAFRSIFDPSCNKNANLEALRAAVLLTDRTANGIIALWISQEQS